MNRAAPAAGCGNQRDAYESCLESDPAGPEAGSYHYPSIIQSADGFLHASYSYHLNRKNLPKDNDGDPAAKTIRHARFNAAWVMKGD